MIKSRVIIEVLGAPKEHVEKAMNTIVGRAKGFGNTKVLKDEIFKVKEEKNKLFSTFAELEIESKDYDTLLKFCFIFMPSSIEILEPNKFEFNAKEFEGSLNDLLATIHNIDMVAKQRNAEKKVLEKNMKMLFRNFVLYAVKKGDKSVENISKNTGIKQEQVKMLLNELKKEALIKQEKGMYTYGK